MDANSMSVVMISLKLGESSEPDAMMEVNIIGKPADLLVVDLTRKRWSLALCKSRMISFYKTLRTGLFASAYLVPGNKQKLEWFLCTDDSLGERACG